MRQSSTALKEQYETDVKAADNLLVNAAKKMARRRRRKASLLACPLFCNSVGKLERGGVIDPVLVPKLMMISPFLPPSHTEEEGQSFCHFLAPHKGRTKANGRGVGRTKTAGRRKVVHQ